MIKKRNTKSKDKMIHTKQTLSKDVISFDDHLNRQQQKQIPKTLLSLSVEQKIHFSTEQINELQRLLDTLPPLTIGELNIYPVEAGKTEKGGYYVNVFIRNGTDLMYDLSLNSISLYLLDKNGRKVAGGQFQFEGFQPLNFGESRYWTFVWRKEEVIDSEADLSSFGVAFG